MNIVRIMMYCVPGVMLFPLMTVLPTSAASGGINSQAAINNLSFDGTLVADPCELDPTTASITLDFGTVVDKYLYRNTRTHGQPFTLRLLECDLNLGNQVELTFKGAESAELPGLLAPESPAASGIAVGMELNDGTPLPLNKKVPAFTLISGINNIILNGYVIGEPSAIKNRTIQRGAFSATATFELNYP